MAKLSNKNYFGRAKREDLESVHVPDADVETPADKVEVLAPADVVGPKVEAPVANTVATVATVAPAPVLVTKASPAPPAVRQDEAENLAKRVGELETRVLLLENKLKTLINVITKEMSSGLKQGPEGLARAIKNSGVLDNL
jgi:hypothetical protein